MFSFWKYMYTPAYDLLTHITLIALLPHLSLAEYNNDVFMQMHVYG